MLSGCQYTYMNLYYIFISIQISDVQYEFSHINWLVYYCGKKILST